MSRQNKVYKNLAVFLCTLIPVYRYPNAAVLPVSSLSMAFSGLLPFVCYPCFLQTNTPASLVMWKPPLTFFVTNSRKSLY